ncbi:membrane-spanning 4-domains subfamily A member 4A-like [Nerophis lumbriciformis]|uniref:membrane-spanning 4-domains subfamily A member 4A-like n=1 Tax=Nerophis lumbriciformis TaxID=546530 RepID=UPI002ADF89EB|nr:uncharacterized protein LOC133579885 [Nerophis lumbriciformis]
MCSLVGHNAAVTMATDHTSKSPPLLKALFCGPMSCLYCNALISAGVPVVFGTIQIMVGEFNMALGVGRTYPSILASVRAAYWLGAVFVTSGILSVWAGFCPSRCLVTFTVVMNIVSAVFAIVAIVLYSIDLAMLSTSLFCGHLGDGSVHDKCEDVAHVAMKLIRAMNITLIVLAVLQLCVSVSMTVIAIKGFDVWNNNQCDDEDDEDVEELHPGMKDVHVDSESVADK